MDVFDKLKILTDAAKYDVACTSSGVDKTTTAGGIGNAAASGICHSFSADGRCIFGGPGVTFYCPHPDNEGVLPTCV